MRGKNQKTILLVEDEAIIALGEKMTLEFYGYEVIIANSGDEAIETIEKTPSIDLILMDINLGQGKMDGTKAAEIILRKRDLPMVFLSSHTDPEIVEKTEKITSYGYVVKNSGSTVLDASIKMAFKLFESKTKEKEKEEALETERGLMLTLIDNLPDNIFIKDTRGGIILDNLAHRRLLGHQELDGVVGKTDRDFFAPALADRYMNDERGIIESGQPLINYEEPTVDAEGLPHWYLTTKIPVRDKHGNITALVGVNRDNTERKKVEIALRESEERFNKAFRSIPDALIISRLEDGKIIDVNNSWHKVFGYSRDEVIGKSSIALNLYADSADRQRAIASLREKGFVRDFELQIRQKSGELRAAILSIELLDIPDEQYMLTVVHDITERKRAEEALKESENKYRLLADNANDVIFVLDMNLKYTYVNPSVKVLRGHEPEEVLKQTPLEALTPSSRDLAMRTLSEIMDLEKSGHREIPIVRTLQLEMTRKDGSTVWTEVKFSFIRNENQRPVGILGITRDITERKRTEEAIQASLREKEVLLREIHHRVKNNMQVISSLFNLQAGHTLNEDGRAILKEAQARIHAMSLVHEKLYKSDHLSRIDFGEYINSLALHLFHAYGVKPGLIRLETEIEDVNLDIASAMPCGLLLNELISNALKYAFPGNRAGVVRIALKRGTGDLIKVLVADDGIGFPEGLDFSKAESFGLQIVNLLVGQLDATIELDRTNGTAFTVTFCELKYPSRA